MKKPDEEEISFLRTDDHVCLSSTGHGGSERFCLSANGFGSRTCFLENLSLESNPADLSLCVFVLDQALSVRALQEVVSRGYDTNAIGGQSGHKTLLYGHAVLLKHTLSNMYLSCLATSSSADKLAFDVGLQEEANSEACWWTVHPASKQRSEGEKVRIGDDLILVSVSSERYLHLTADSGENASQSVIASFQQTLWTVIPVSSGVVRQKSMGMAFGGDVLRLIHGDECLTVPHSDGEPNASQGSVMYEIGAVNSHARSLWRLELIKTKWSGGFITWDSKIRLRHVTSGRYLCVSGIGSEVTTVHRNETDELRTAFFVRQSKDDKKSRWEEREEEGMGSSDIKFGETMVFFQHVSSNKWLSYEAYEVKKRGVGRVEEKQAVVLVEGHMDDGFNLAKGQEEESKSAWAIRRCASVFTRFIQVLDEWQTEEQRSALSKLNLDEVIRCLEDLIDFFKRPNGDEEHEVKQAHLTALKNRQDLFQEEGIINLMLGTIDKFTGAFKERRDFIQALGEDKKELFDQLSNYLYLLLAAMIRGNRANCAQFAQVSRMDWMFLRLESSQSAEGVLDVLHCVLTDSDEALNIITDAHIRILIRLLDKKGRDPRVLQVLCSLCIGRQGGAVRLNQSLIYDNLLPDRDLLLQTRLVDLCSSVRPNLFIGVETGSATYLKWYYEVRIDSIEHITNNKALLRVGWANNEGFCPFPGGRRGWGSCAVGDDLFSFGFDGENLWTGGKPKRIRNAAQQPVLSHGDIIGCMLDLSVPVIQFAINNEPVKGYFRDFNIEGIFYPCLSASAKVSVRMIFGGPHGRLRFGPPEGYSAMFEALLPKERLRIEPCFSFGNLEKSIYAGNSETKENVVFIPRPVDTNEIELQVYVENIRDKLAENIHEMWAMQKIEQGWIFGPTRDDQSKTHPCLTTFERLPNNERQFDITLAYETLRTIVALGYRINYEMPSEGSRLKTIKLPNSFLQTNGYRPQPLDLSNLTLSVHLEVLVDQLAENTHNIWARDRIKQGWSYGCIENNILRRSPHLVPYEKVDDNIKKSNRQTAIETVKTLLAYNYSIDTAPTDAAEMAVESDEQSMNAKSVRKIRTFRAQSTWKVTGGKWYYEVELLTCGFMRFGWVSTDFESGCEIGSNYQSYAFDVESATKWNMEGSPYGKVCQPGDVIGCMLDLQDHTITFSLNGELMMDPMGQEIAFKKMSEDIGFVPGFSFGPGQYAKINLGNDVHTLKYFTCCGLQEGYSPYCVNMSRPVPLWYSRENPCLFVDIDKENPCVEVQVHTGSSPTLKMISKTFGVQKSEMEFLRLGLPVKCKDHFTTKSIQERYASIELLRRQLDPMQNHIIHDSSLDQMPNYPGTLNRNFAKNLPSNITGSNLDINKKGKKIRLAKNPFKKNRSRDASPDIAPAPGNRSKKHHVGIITPVGAGPGSSSGLNGAGGSTQGLGDLGSISVPKLSVDDNDYLLPEMQTRENSLVDLMDQYFFSVVVLPGQDPKYIHIGWITSSFKLSRSMLSKCGDKQESNIRSRRRSSLKTQKSTGSKNEKKESHDWEIPHVTICQLENDLSLKSSVVDSCMYTINVADILNNFGTQDDLGKRMSQGVLIGCFLDTATGQLTFELNSRELPISFQVAPMTNLYPAMFVKPSAREFASFELGRTRNTLPVIAGMLRPPKKATPVVHSRLKLQMLHKSHWSRVVNTQSRIHILKLNETRGWSLLNEESVQMMAVHIPEEDRCLDILELDEHPQLLRFHCETLELYKTICCSGNHNVAQSLTTHMDENQFLYIIQNHYLHGELRAKFFDLLISMHLESHSRLKIETQNEFIVPLHCSQQANRASVTAKNYLKSQYEKRDNEFQKTMDDVDFDFHKIPSQADSCSIRPNLINDDVTLRMVGENGEEISPKIESCPEIKYDRLRSISLKELVDAVNRGAHIVEPIGGTPEHIFVPLLRIIYNLLTIGILDSNDINVILSVLDPVSFKSKPNLKLATVTQSILDMPLQEPVKLQLCVLLHKLCDIQLRHRVESVVHMSNYFVKSVQNDQLRRYVEIKQSDLPSAVTAKMTREFRCPPEEQMAGILNFHHSFNTNNEEKEEISSCAEEVKKRISIFHRKLMDNCGVPPPDGLDLDDLLSQGLKTKRSRSLHLLPIGIGHPEEGESMPQFVQNILHFFERRNNTDNDNLYIENIPECKMRNLSQVIKKTLISWAKSAFIEDIDLIREMFSLLFRQYSALGEIDEALRKTYVISYQSKDDVTQLLRSLGRVRCLLGVQVGESEEMLLKNCLWDIMNNKVFFQHPNLTRCLAVHETVMQLMVHTLNRAKIGNNNQKNSNQICFDSGNVLHENTPLVGQANMIPSLGNMPVLQEESAATEVQKKKTDGPAEMVVQCCRFLCYFCRTSSQNQKTMFEHLSYMLENSSMLLARPSLRGTCPLDVAYSSLMDNNELALALREKQLEKVAIYLARCGVQSNAELLGKGYPDIGWDPVEGERFLDFLRFTVWVNGESMEENANLVVRLLIRRPECLGPALKGSSSAHIRPDVGMNPKESTAAIFVGEAGGDGVPSDPNVVKHQNVPKTSQVSGGGLLKAMKEGLVMSAQIKLHKLAQEAEAGIGPDENPQQKSLPMIFSDYEDANLFSELPYYFNNLPPEDDPDYVDLGAAILTFYSVLVDLLGRCSPEHDTSKSSSIRVRAILQSLVSMEDLEGVLSLQFILPTPQMELTVNEDGEEEWKDKAGMPPGLLPEHKASVVLFLERVYGIQDCDTFLGLLENAFLPDMRAATVLDMGSSGDSDFALALNRYLGNSVLPLLTKHSHYLGHWERTSSILEVTLQTTYRYSRCHSLTKGQREEVSDFLVALTQQLQPSMMTKLLRKLVIDVPSLSPESVVPLRLLTPFYQRCGLYYSSTGLPGQGIANEEEKQLTGQLFSGIFDNLAKLPYDPELFSKALPCLTAIGCALSPDYSFQSSLGTTKASSVRSQVQSPSLAPGGPGVTEFEEQIDINMSMGVSTTDDEFKPIPVDTTQIRLPNSLEGLLDQFAQHLHDSWALEMVESGYSYGPTRNDFTKTHPNLIPFQILSQDDQLKYIEPVIDALKAMLAWGWTIDADLSRIDMHGDNRRRPTISSDGYNPNPKDLRGVNVTREMLDMAEKLAENAHNIWAQAKKADMETIGGGVHQLLVPYELLTDKEKRRYRKLTNEMLKYLQYNGYRLSINSTMAPIPKVQSGIVRHGMERTSDSGDKKAWQRQKSQPAGSGEFSKSSMETSRFAYVLLSKLLRYVEQAIVTIQQTLPSSRYSRNLAFSQESEDIKFFGKVVLPLVERYFEAHKNYFVGPQSMALNEEKKMAATLFCKLFSLLRQKITAFGHDINISVRCLQGLVQAFDIKAIVKISTTSEDFVRVRLLPFFVNCADDLTLLVQNLTMERFTHLKGTIERGAVSVNYMHMVLLPVMKSMFDHISKTNTGEDLLVGDIQVACYKILNALYLLGTKSSQYTDRQEISAEFNRHRPLLGECVAAIAHTFPVAFLEPHLNKNNKYSILYNCPGEYSLEAREILGELEKNLPHLDAIVEEIADLAESGGKYTEAPHVIEVTLPMLCSYLPIWWSRGPEHTPPDKDASKPVTTVTAKLINNVLGNVLKLIKNNIDSEVAPWMTRIAMRTQPIVGNATADMLGEHFLPVAEKLKTHAFRADKEEELYLMEKRSGSEAAADREEELNKQVEILVRNMFAFYPLLIKYVDLHRTAWLKEPTKDTDALFTVVAEIFMIWTKSVHFKREEQNFVSQNEIDHLSLIMPGHSSGSDKMKETGGSSGESLARKAMVKKARLSNYTSLNVACIKRLLPIGLSMFGGREQELIQKAKQKLIDEASLVSRDTPNWIEAVIQKENDGEIEEYLKSAIDQEEDADDNTQRWQKVLYKKIGQAKLLESSEPVTKERMIQRVLLLAKVLHGLYLVDHPPSTLKGSWKKLISSQRKRAVMACFRMLPLHSLPRHRGVNLFLKGYRNIWLKREEPITVKLIEEVTESAESMEKVEPNQVAQDDASKELAVNQNKDLADNSDCEPINACEVIPFTSTPDPLMQLITALKRTAMDQASDDPLYLSYARIMSKSCSGQDDDDDDEGDGEDNAKSLQEQEMEKLQILSEQGRLSDRGAAEMVLLEICGGRGNVTPIVQESIELGISLLLGGNTNVQGRMLNFLREKKLSGFFTSCSGLMQQCSVLDLDTFERCNKAEGLAAGGLYDLQGITNLYDAEFTCKLFRFLQLLCEGHNLSFQDYLRSQAGNTTTVNIIICTVDYLLRMQESIMDFYWHYTGKDTIERAGKLNLVKAIKIGKQVFRTLTEYIQGPCVGNQLALAHSRLWDAISGFLFIFAHMQDKLSKDPEQLELLREFMKLQKEMMIMLLSMLEGNVVNGPIGRQMVDTLVESSSNVEMILKFFDIFLRMKDITSSEAFLAFDINKDGWISHKEFRTAMEQQKMYANEEIEYIMMCVDSNNDGKVDFNEFTDRFHDPAKDIGFSVAVLLTNLYEHMPNDLRLERLVNKAKRMIETFEPYLGRIEITGRSGRIERVYFEIRQSHIDQWEKPQIKDSKRSFLHSVVNEGGDKEKLESFVNFCEDTIYEMQHSQRISGEGEGLRLIQVSAIQDLLGANKLMMISKAFSSVTAVTSLLNWSNIKHSWRFFKSISIKDMIFGVTKFQIYLFTLMMMLLWKILCFSGRFFVALINGPKSSGDRLEFQESLEKRKAWLLPAEEQLILERLDPTEIALLDEYQEEGYNKPVTIHNVPDNQYYFNKTDESDSSPTGSQKGQEAVVSLRCSTICGPQKGQLDFQENRRPSSKAHMPVLTPDISKQEVKVNVLEPDSELVEEDEDDTTCPFEMKKVDTGTYIISLFAKNLYNFKIYALVLAFFINFMLLFYEVEQVPSSDPEKMNSTDPEDMEEFVVLSDSLSYMRTLFKILAGLHSTFALSMLIAYYCLKVPLVLFKREKEISRMLEFEGMWISEQPSDDNLKAHWDKLVLSTASFPQNYWDKFIKKKVRIKYSEQYDYNEITTLLGMAPPDESALSKQGWLRSKLRKCDFQYQVWKWGVIFTDNSFLYLMLYFMASLIGNFNYFFFACHLLDVAISFKTLRTILQSVTHNGKQLVLTVMLTSVIIYLYTVIAFNFFRKFYVKDNDGVKDMKCHNMMTCFVFHLHTGLRAGGGIGDEIESPDGDPNENFRIIFDITFFFFVIVILLAIIQGLIIDAFGELRDQLEQVKEDMESKCFICGIGKEYFDKVPHGFEQHVEKEHNFASYMYFLMHIINKPDTEYTGQETYVWELYQQRCWDFFPVGDCFRKQYEEELKV